ncbi:hypothetical protein TNIN_116321 [Trichonephila inaurata madagascariensis]|uniref:Uncharacterized protein n=1 Tax=Trichonephila inaurata madagascariensis TaxID=2747483 RepID=A0A8X6WSV8_9ARAC|nr:hypothetical protein TNIN_116321 [Trichonephila inaurata madagascariensis]
MPCHALPVHLDMCRPLNNTGMPRPAKGLAIGCKKKFPTLSLFHPIIENLLAQNPFKNGQPLTRWHISRNVPHNIANSNLYHTLPEASPWSCANSPPSQKASPKPSPFPPPKPGRATPFHLDSRNALHFRKSPASPKTPDGGNLSSNLPGANSLFKTH